LKSAGAEEGRPPAEFRRQAVRLVLTTDRSMAEVGGTLASTANT
jgi:transposase-like protein